MECTQEEIIEQANNICKSHFMDFPDYNEDEPITCIDESIAVLLSAVLIEIEGLDIYNFLKNEYKKN